MNLLLRRKGIQQNEMKAPGLENSVGLRPSDGMGYSQLLQSSGMRDPGELPIICEGFVDKVGLGF